MPGPRTKRKQKSEVGDDKTVKVFKLSVKDVLPSTLLLHEGAGALRTTASLVLT